MTALWPQGLPQYVLREGFAETPHWPLHAFQPEDGPPQHMPMTTVDLRSLQCGMVMRAHHLELFEDFLFHDLGKASLPFIGPHPRTRASWQLMFMNSPTPFRIVVRTGIEWTVTFTLMALGSAD